VYERIFNRMRTQAQSGPLSGLTKRIFEWSLGVARQHARADDPGRRLRVKHALADRLVYSTVKDEMGGRLECMVSGGGSLSEDLARLFKGMGVPILEGYGLTETSPVVSVNTPDDVRPGTLGPPLEGVEIAFDESPSVGTGHIDAKGRVGELLVRGDNVSDGYWNQPGATKRAFTDAVPSSEHAVESIDASGQTEDQTTETGEGQQTDDGQWFRTGDLIEQTPDGFLVFHERLKQLFVLTTGKNVAPGPIEDRFATSDRIQQIMVVGDDEKFVGALVVPDFERLATWAQERGYELPENRELLIEDERVNAWVGAEIDQVNENLERIEQIKQFALVPEEWSSENDMLTPSMKKKRRNILDSYDDLVTEIYEE
jgi:long-chain acyl-CoA synthetase